MPMDPSVATHGARTTQKDKVRCMMESREWMTAFMPMMTTGRDPPERRTASDALLPVTDINQMADFTGGTAHASLSPAVFTSLALRTSLAFAVIMIFLSSVYGLVFLTSVPGGSDARPCPGTRRSSAGTAPCHGPDNARSCHRSWAIPPRWPRALRGLCLGGGCGWW